MGRPSFSPTEKHLKAAYKAAFNGQNEAEISKTLGIGYATFQRHKEEFRGEVKRGRDDSFDDRLADVKGSLLSLCLPFEEIKTVKKKNKQGKLVIVEETRINRLPNPTSVFFYLVNKGRGEFHSINNPVVESDSNKGEIRQWFEAARKRYEDKQKPKPEPKLEAPIKKSPTKKKKSSKKTKKSIKKTNIIKSDSKIPVKTDTTDNQKKK